jgi:hypothetical protein
MKAATDEVAGNALITTIHLLCAPDEELGIPGISFNPLNVVEKRKEDKSTI